MRKVAEAVYDAFARTEYGRELELRPRYSRFVPKGWTVSQWEQLFGPHANNLHHMWQSIDDAHLFVLAENKLEPGKFSFKEGEQLTTAAAAHDQPEVIVGDIPAGRKTKIQIQQEADAFRAYEAGFTAGLDERYLETYRFARDQIVLADKCNKLPAAFFVIELVGFMSNVVMQLQRLQLLDGGPLTTVAARRVGIIKPEDFELARIALRRMSTEILGSDVIESFVGYCGQFPSVNQYLLEWATVITAGMDGVRLNEDFDWYEADDPNAKKDEKRHRIEKFKQQQAIWRSWEHSSLR